MLFIKHFYNKKLKKQQQQQPNKPIQIEFEKTSRVADCIDYFVDKKNSHSRKD